MSVAAGPAAGRGRQRRRRAAVSVLLFLLLASISFAGLFALADMWSPAPVVVSGATSLPVVPALLASDRHDWAENGHLSGATPEAAGQVPAGWHLFEVTSAGARLQHQPGEAFYELSCDAACIAGIWQRLASLPAGAYRLEADVYLQPPESGQGVVEARVGFDIAGGGSPTASSVAWSKPVQRPGWQQVALEVKHAGGPASVFVACDRLATAGSCRIAAVRLLGPPPPTATAPRAAAPSPSPAATAPASPATPEVRALYVGAADLAWSGPAEVRSAVQKAAAAGFNTLYWQVREVGYAYYDSGVEPRAAVLAGEPGKQGSWDPLAEAVAAAHGQGLRLYAWVQVLPIWRPGEPPAHSQPEHMYNLFALRLGQGWLQWPEGDAAAPAAGPDGYLYASPAVPEVGAYLAAIVHDLTSRYALDGLYLSGLAYAGPGFSHDPASQSAYDKAKGEQAGLSFAAFQRQQLTDLLTRLAEEGRGQRPGLRFCAELEPVTSGGERYQDAGQWLAAGAADSVALRPEGESATDATPAGTGAETPASRMVVIVGGKPNSFAELARDIAHARQAGAAGVAVYSFAMMDQRNYWQDLASGPFTSKAVAP